MSAKPRTRRPPGQSAALAESGEASALDRASELMRLLPLWPNEITDPSPEGRRRLLAMLKRALRAERQRGLAGHWAYDLSRHAQLLRHYRLECGRASKITGDANAVRGKNTPGSGATASTATKAVKASN